MRSLQDMALCTGTPQWRIDQLVTGQTLPAWDEAQLLAWHFKVPLSQLIQPIQRECASRGPSAAVRAWTTPRGNANRTMSLHALATVHPSVFDVTLAEWPAQLAPNLAECLAAEVAILHIIDGSLSNCRDAVRAPRSLDQCPDHSIQSIDDDLRSATNGTLGVESRIQALSIRHALRISAPHAIDVHDLALRLDAALSALIHPIHLLRVFRWSDVFDAPDPPTPLLRLAATDRRALANILSDAIADLNNIASELHRLAVSIRHQR